MRKSLYKIAIFAVLLTMFIVFVGQRTVYWNPIIRGDTSGLRGSMTVLLGDPTADTWLWGDTLAAGMYVPEQDIEITDIKIFGDPDSGDSCRVIVYSAETGAGTGAQTICSSDTLVGTTWAQVDDQTMSGTYKTVTTAEGLGVFFDFIAGTPNSVSVTLEFKTRLQDAYE
jgi:hypothetical protein